MPKQIEVKVKDISRDDNGQPTELFGTTRILTYKAFLYLNVNPENPRYELIGEVDEKGELVPGNPNLNAQHRPSAQSQRSAEPVGNTGPTARELELLEKIAQLERAQQAQTALVPEAEKAPPNPVAEQVATARAEQKKAGRGKKLNSVAEVGV